MQGGIRRKKDLLPRFRSRSGSKKRGGLLTTPMKKLLIYSCMMLGLLAMFRYSYWDLNKQPEYELDQAAPSPERLEAAAAAAVAAAAAAGSADKDKDKEREELERAAGPQFNNEVALQQEVQNLEKEYKPGGVAAAAPNVAAGLHGGGVPGVAEQKKPEVPLRPPPGGGGAPGAAAPAAAAPAAAAAAADKAPADKAPAAADKAPAAAAAAADPELKFPKQARF